MTKPLCVVAQILICSDPQKSRFFLWAGGGGAVHRLERTIVVNFVSVLCHQPNVEIKQLFSTPIQFLIWSTEIYLSHLLL